MGSKPIFFLAISLAAILLIIIITSDEVLARDLTDTTAGATSLPPASAKEAENKTEVKDAKYPCNGNFGRYVGEYLGGCRRGSNGGGYGGLVCVYGCCRRSYFGRGCKRCCAYKGESMDAEPQAKPHN